MAIEIPVMAITSEIDIGRITGIAALIATALTFAITYGRNRKSEQIRIASDIWDKMDKHYLPFKIKCKKYYDLGESSEEAKNLKTEIAELAVQYLELLNFLAYLILEKEIKNKKLINYYKKDMLKTYAMFREYLDENSFPHILEFREYLDENSFPKILEFKNNHNICYKYKKLRVYLGSYHICHVKFELTYFPRLCVIPILYSFKF
jgi:hypothetical protein